MVDTSELIEIANTRRSNRSGDVIFIHGLNGNGRQYWIPDGHPECFWPRWIGEDIEEVGVWSISYPASAFAWQGAVMPLGQRVASIINLLLVNGLITERPVVFITHSLGGLLVKQMLRSARDGTVANAESLVEQTKGIVFIATPHQGSNLANIVDSLGFSLSNDIVENLKRDQPNLIDLNTWFVNNFNTLDIQVQAFCETLPTPLGRRNFFGRIIRSIVVNCTSANPMLPKVNVVPLDKDHISICQLYNREENLLYKNVVPFIKKCLLSSPDKIPTVAPPSKEVELKSDKNVNYTKLRSLLVAGKWKEADQETTDKMLQVLGKDSWLDIETENIDSFPCNDLRTIDQLWLKYSEGRFGFSIQNKIWQEVAGEVDIEREKKLGYRVGWRKEEKWLSYSELTFNLDAPEGHLPWTPLKRTGGGRGSGEGARWVSSLVRRIVTCNI